MFCTQCGNEIGDSARFCTACGAPVNRDDGGAALAASEVAKAAADERVDQAGEAAAAAALAAEVAASGGSADAAAPAMSVASADSADRSEPVTFAAAMDAAKQKSKRRIPMVVLVALALALTVGVAYAAYRVYTDVYLPSQQVQAEQAAQEPAPDEPAQTEDLSEYVDVWVVDTETMTAGMASESPSTYQYQYDQDGRLTERANTSSGESEVFSYSGSRISAVDSLGGSYGDVTFAYDEEGRCVERTYVMVIIGSFHQVIDCRVTERYSYDDQDRVVDTVQATEVLNGAVYDDGDLPSGELKYTYDGSTVTATVVSGSPTRRANVVCQDIQTENGNIVSVTTLVPYSDLSSATYEYTYKQITVKRSDWMPNLYTNPTIGVGDLAGAAPCYNLPQETIDAIMGE
ncbi:MAG: zinc ribbon domain-containing protein [Eggerthellaceae bacterium]|nr:zinc ribbon domain-containing protein [Eggerthellaceae bacterium]